MTKKDIVVTKILTQIKTGILAPGDKLPSLRQISERNHVSLYTAIGAYEELVDLGVIENRPKVGSFVIESGDSVEQLLQMRNISIPARGKLTASDKVLRYEQCAENFGKMQKTPGVRLLHEYVGENFYDDTPYQTLREVVRKVPVNQKWQYFLEAKNKLVSSIAQMMLPQKCFLMRDSMQLVGNPMEALLLAIVSCNAVATEPGLVLGIESPGNRLFRIAAHMLNIKFVELPSDPITGLRVEAVEEELRKGTRFMGLICQGCRADPTGATMPIEAKERLVKLCERHNIMIIEYNAFGNLFLESENIPPIKSLNHESVIYISDMGCAMGYDLPLVYMESGKYATQISAFQIFCRSFLASNESIAVAAELIGKEIPANAKALCGIVRSCTELFVQTLRSAVPETVQIFGENAGPYLWIKLPEGTSAEAFSEFAEENQVFVAPGQMFSELPEYSNCIRVNCCVHRQKKDIVTDAKTLGETISGYLKNI